MARVLSQTIQDQVTYKNISTKYVLTINSTDYSGYLLNYQISTDKEFGSASATFTLDNDSEMFGN